MKHLIFTILCLSFFLSSGLDAQRTRASEKNMSSFDGSKNAFYAEILGNGLIFSANYDVRLINKFGARVGLGYVGGSEGSVLTVPVMGNILLGKNGKYFEVGAGVTFLSGAGDLFDLSEDKSTTLGTLSFMYRRQPEDGGFMWKIGITPFIASGVFVPYWAGLGLGYCW